MEYFTENQKLLLMEASMTSTLLANGLDFLKKSNIDKKGYYYQAFFSLSSGIERLLKILLIYDFREKNNDEFPDNNYLKKKGHKIYGMIEEFCPRLLEDNLDSNIIAFLSEFAISSRYYNLDVLTGESNNGEPLKNWKRIQEELVIHYNIRTELSEQEIFVSSMINQSADVLFNSIDSRTITNYTELFKDTKEQEKIQGYAVQRIFSIIRTLVYILGEYEYRNQFYPYLSEFFRHYRGTYTPYELRNKRNWRNIIEG